MSVEIRVPAFGESVVEATVSRWLKQEGDPVAAGEALVELETDKINVEVPSEQAGVLERITKREGETVAVNDVIAVVGERSGNGATASAPPPAAAPAPTPPAAAPPAAEVVAAAPQEAEAAGNGRAKASATPMAQKLAQDRGLNLDAVPGSGAGGKITKEDVERYIERASLPTVSYFTPPPVSEPEPAPAAPAPQPSVEVVTPAPSPAERMAQPAPPSGPALFGYVPDPREEVTPMSRLRQTIAERLKDAQNTAAMLTTFNEVDMTAVMEVRKRRRDAFKEKHGVGLGFMSFFTKAVIGALKAFPHLNAEIRGADIVLKRHYDIGVAVSTERGLVVPILRDADRKTFAEIEKEVGELAGRAREGKLTLQELQGGTFTITNGGVFGSLLSTPILNTPQVGILGMHKIQERPVALNGEVVIRPMMYLALTYDHRIVDGSEAVRFLVRLKELIEDPESLLLEG